MKYSLKGFSLTELLIVVSIMGILSAIVIPSYNKHKVKSVQSALQSSLQIVGDAFILCLAKKSLSDCNNLEKIKVDCPNCENVSTRGTATLFCADARIKSGGTTYKTCINTNGGGTGFSTNWPRLCKEANQYCLCNASGRCGNHGPRCTSIGCGVPSTYPTNCTPEKYYLQKCTGGGMTNGSRQGWCSNGLCH